MHNRVMHHRAGIVLIVHRELRRMMRYKRILLMAVVLPLLSGLILMRLFNSGLATDLPIAMLDQDHSHLSRQIIRRVDATPEAYVAYHVNDLAEARRLLLSGHIYAIVMLPAHLERDGLLGRSPEVVTFYNNQFMTTGSILSKGISAALAGVATEFKISSALKMGQPFALAKSSLSPIPLEQHILFNPTLNYIYTLLSGMWPTLMQIVIAVTAAYAVSVERKTPAKWAVFNRMGHGVYRAMLGKLLPYFFIFGSMLVFADMVFFMYLGLPFNGSLFIYLPSGVLFIFSYLMLGSIAALLCKNAEQALSSMGLFCAPAFGFIGVGFPRLAMGLFPTIWGGILPITWYVRIRADQTLRGAGLDASIKPLASLFALNLILLLILFLLCRKEAAQARPITTHNKQVCV